MARRITLSLIVMLLVSAFVFVSCTQEAGGKKPGPAPTPREPVVNELGDVSENLVYNGDFEASMDDMDVAEDGSEIEVQAGVGVDNSNALYIFQNSDGGWGEVLIDITKYYGRGKSYYVEASFKNSGEEGTPANPHAFIDFTLVSGAGFDKYGKIYDVDGQYDYGWLSDDMASEIFEIDTIGGDVGVDISDGNWHTISAILDAETIEEMITTQTAAHGTGDKEPSLYYMAVVFLVGTYPNQDGYKYYLDNVVIKDLNEELDRTGKTWEAEVVDE